MFQFELPEIGEGVIEGEVVRWLVAEGDLIAEDQPVCEIMTDKATVEISTPKSGKVVKLYHAEGDMVPVHTPLVDIATGDLHVLRGQRPLDVAAGQPEAGHAREVHVDLDLALLTAQDGDRAHPSDGLQLLAHHRARIFGDLSSAPVGAQGDQHHRQGARGDALDLRLHRLVGQAAEHQVHAIAHLLTKKAM